MHDFSVSSHKQQDPLLHYLFSSKPMQMLKLISAVVLLVIALEEQI